MSLKIPITYSHLDFSMTTLVFLVMRKEKIPKKHKYFRTNAIKENYSKLVSSQMT